jgi:hypothetical protein
MSHVTQLLCTFTTLDQLDDTLAAIVRSYEIAFGTIYVLENVESPGALCCTYNIPVGSPVVEPIPPTTISLHRKKATNTLYTINALNAVVVDLNGGRMDKRFVIPWENYQNTILVTAYGTLKTINTKLHKIVRVAELVR